MDFRSVIAQIVRHRSVHDEAADRGVDRQEWAAGDYRVRVRSLVKAESGQAPNVFAEWNGMSTLEAKPRETVERDGTKKRHDRD